MVIGQKDDFAIECIHEPDTPNEHGWVFGRMCVWCRGVELGDLTEPACMLNGTEGHFQEVLDQIDDLHDDCVDDLPDKAAFHLLDSALYLDDDRTSQQVYEDAIRYSKFDFLTNWGESFDGVKAFLLIRGERCRVLYRLSCGTLGGAEVTRDGLIDAMQAFLEWMATKKRAVQGS